MARKDAILKIREILLVRRDALVTFEKAWITLELPAVRALPSYPSWNFPVPPHIGQVLSVAFSPTGQGTVYAGVEVGGLRRVHRNERVMRRLRECGCDRLAVAEMEIEANIVRHLIIEKRRAGCGRLVRRKFLDVSHRARSTPPMARSFGAWSGCSLLFPSPAFRGRW